jgi:hypothetical protein
MFEPDSQAERNRDLLPAYGPDRLALDLATLDVASIASISGGDEIASLTSGHALADLAATCCCGTCSCCTCAAADVKGSSFPKGKSA